MPRHSICLITGHDADLLTAGVALHCKDHKHIDLATAQLMASGTKLRPWLDPDHDPRVKADAVSEPYRPTAQWALLPCEECDAHGCAACNHKGTFYSQKYLIAFSAREWQVIGGTVQYALLGESKQRRKMSRTHLRRGRRSRSLITDSMLRPKLYCRPSLERAHAAAV